MDNLGYGEVGVYGGGVLRGVPTPRIDRLAAEGMRLTNFTMHQIGIFYDVHITPWLQLTGDLQIIRPNLPGTGTAIVPGGRLRIVF